MSMNLKCLYSQISMFKLTSSSPSGFIASSLSDLPAIRQATGRHVTLGGKK